MSDSWRPQGLQHARLPYPSLSPRACSNSCPLSRWCHPTISSLSSPSPPALSLSQNQGLFQWVSPLHQVAKVLEFQLQHQSFQYSGLIFFRIDWLDLLAVQGTLKSLLQHHSSKALILRCSALFIVQLSHPYMTTGKTIALTRQTFVTKVMSLLFNMLSRLVIAFLPRSKCLLISWLRSPSAVILEPRKIVWHCFHCFPIYFPWSHGTGCHDLHFLNVEFKASFWTLLFHFHEEALQFLFAFCHKGGVICMSEVIDISPGNLDSSLCFMQSSIPHDVLCI